DVQVQALGVIRPGAARTVETAALVVHPLDRACPRNQFPTVHQHLCHAASRGPAGRRMVIILLGELTTSVRASPHRRTAGLTLPEQPTGSRCVLVRHCDALLPCTRRRVAAVETVVSTPAGTDRTSGVRAGDTPRRGSPS